MISDVRDRIQEEVKKSLSQLDSLVAFTGLPVFRDKNGNPLWADMRELDLRYQVPVGKVSRFFEGLKEGKVLGTRCRRCGSAYFPPQVDCPKCRTGSHISWEEVPVEGELLTFTRIEVKPPSFSHYPPYTVGVGRFGDFGVVAWVKTDSPTVGMRVKLRVNRRDPEGYITYNMEP